MNLGVSVFIFCQYWHAGARINITGVCQTTPASRSTRVQSSTRRFRLEADAYL